MHPQIVRNQAGFCPICGMALEPRVLLADTDDDELRRMTRRLWSSTVLTAPILILAMGHDLYPAAFPDVMDPPALPWIQMILATPVLLWGGWPFFARG